MSADNGVYVLVTENLNGNSEYRVAYAHAIDNVYGKYNPDIEGFEGDLEALQATFGESQVFQTLDEAIDLAEEIAYTHEYLEDGICVLSDFQHLGYIFETGERSEKD